MKHIRFFALFALLGFFAIVSQIILQRRFMVVFGGNEITIGIVFAAWMLWMGLGNFAAGKFADRIGNIFPALLFSVSAASVLLPATVFFSSLVKAVLGMPPPQMIGPPLILFSTLILMAPLCLATGISMVFAVRVFGTNKSEDIGRFYIFDSIGSALGGFVFSLFAVRFLTPLKSAFLVSAILIAGTALTLKDKLTSKIILSVLAVFLAVCFFKSPLLGDFCNRVQWKGYNVISESDSRFGNIVVTENRNEHTLFFDGIPQFSTPLPETYETAAYLPLLMHQDPKDVLIIGGGLSGMIQQWRDVGLDSITYVQIDPDITKTEGRLMAAGGMMFDPRLKIYYGDGRNYLKEIGRPYFDVVIVLAGDPATAAANRYYTREFFDDVSRVIRKNGIIYFGIFEPTNYISEDAAGLLGTIYATLSEKFGHIVVLPLDKYYFFASKDTGVLTDDVEVLRSRIKERGYFAPTLSTQNLFGIFPERIAGVKKSIVDTANVKKQVNLDKRPIAYFAALVLWASKGSGGAADFLKSLQGIRFWHLAIVIGFGFILSVILGRMRPAGMSAFWILFAVGFSSITYEIILLVWYQVKVGLLFYRLGIIITAFMAGLPLGARLAMQTTGSIEGRRMILVLIAYAFYMPLLFFFSSLSFPLANGLCGLGGGFLYQCVANQLVSERRKVGEAAGLINFSDYIGAAAGSILASMVMIPLFGLFATLILAALMLIISAVVYSLALYGSDISR